MDAASPAQQNRPEVEHRPAPASAPPRRRPSGEPPPLPHQLGRTGKFWLVMVAYFLVTTIGVLTFPTFARYFEKWDTERLRWIAAIRTPWLTQVMLAVNVLAASWTIRVLRWSAWIALIVFRRWRHLLVFIGAVSRKPYLLLVSGANRVNEKGVAAHLGEKLTRPDADAGTRQLSPKR